MATLRALTDYELAMNKWHWRCPFPDAPGYARHMKRKPRRKDYTRAGRAR